MDQSLIQQAADRLWQAQQTLTPCAPVRELFEGGLDADTAYRIQQINLDRAVAQQGKRIAGKKIGLTSPAVQRQLGVDSPDYGSLFADRIFAEGQTLSLSGLGLLQPKVEAEVALVLKKDLPDETNSIVDLIQAVDYVLPAVEIVDSRVRGWDIRIGDTVADNASYAAVVVGQRPVRLADADLIAAGMQMFSDGLTVSEGRGSACLGNPLVAALWLADTVARRGTPLRAGDLVLTGALGPMTAVTRPAAYRAVIEGLGSVTVDFSA